MVAVFDYHRKRDYADLYSLHGWCGILVCVLYFVQVSLSSTPGLGHCTGERRKRLKCLQQRGLLSRGLRMWQVPVLVGMLPPDAVMGMNLGL